ncbi:hypothetical protein [Synechococcus sp. W4D4]|uniref:hypothetical protein n=1 Tax=Synechococcus sp. W4D4 TaxID=3392294 RepID=UPI0039E831B0
MKDRDVKARLFVWPILTTLVLAILIVQTNEYGATWDEFLYFKGVRGVVRHGVDILMGRGPDTKDIFGDLALFGHTSRFVPFLLSQANVLQVANLESLTDAQKFLLGSFTSLNHLSSVVFGWMTGCLLSVVAWKSGRRYLSALVFFLIVLFPEWTGSSFFNNSDIPQAFMFTCFSLTWAVQGWLGFVSDNADRKRIWIWATLAGVWAGLSVSTRPGSVVFICFYYIALLALVYVLRKTGRWGMTLLSIGISMIIASIVFYLTYPQGWDRWPWQSIYEAVGYISDRQKGSVVEAATYLANQLYESLPLLYVVGLVSLIYVFFNRIIESRINCRVYLTRLCQDKWFWIYLSMILQVMVPIILVSLSGTILYNRLRHIMLIYPPLVMLSSLGLQLALTGETTSAKHFYRISIAVVSIFTVAEIVLLSPYQYTYKSDVSRLVDLRFGTAEHTKSRYYGLNNDYYGAAQKRLFAFCVEDKSCLSELVNSHDGVRQSNGIVADSGSFNKELFDASRLLFLRPEKEREPQDGPKRGFYLFSTNKFRDLDDSNCSITNSLTRQILVPVKKASIGELLFCN